MTTNQENHRVFEGLSAIRVRNRFRVFRRIFALLVVSQRE